MDTFIREVQNAHNEKRQNHGTAPLKHNPELSELAQKWADHLADIKTLQHSDQSYKGTQLGENCASRWSSAPGGADYTGDQVVDQWYKEIEKHDFVKNDYNPGTCHFSQVVWKGSQEFGVGKAKTSDGRCYVVCNYYPPGNVMGRFPDNIGQPKGGFSTPKVSSNSPSSAPASALRAPSSKGGNACQGNAAKSSPSMNTFIKEVQDAHNDKRRDHGTAPLKHNPELTELAQKWADHLADIKTLKHSDQSYKGTQLGENCASRWSTAPGGADYTGEQVVEQWYKEVEKHDFVKNDYNPGTCHFSQVVWKGSQEFGVGKAKTSDGRCYVVCNYYPPGNVMGRFPDNIGQPKGGVSIPSGSSAEPTKAAARAPNTKTPPRDGASALVNATKHSLSLDDFIQEVVSAHNVRRQKHGASKVKHNPDLTSLAQQWADHLASTKVLQHSDHSYHGKQLGENCASRWSSAGADYNGEEVVEQWYKEIEKHDFVKNDYNPGTCHFSQVVWKGSEEIGVGKAKTSDGRCYVVCNYHPAGNVLGHFQANIGKLQ